MDGEIEYSRYSLTELREAESHISREKYPQNYSNLKQELQRRLESQGEECIADVDQPEERVWAKAPDLKTAPEIALRKLTKYALSFVAIATALDATATSILEANGYSLGNTPKILHWPLGSKRRTTPISAT